METKNLSENRAATVDSSAISGKQLVNDLMLKESQVEPERIKNGTLTDKDWEKLINAADIVSRNNDDKQISAWDLENYRYKRRKDECKRIIHEFSTLADAAESICRNKDQQSPYDNINSSLIVDSVRRDMIYAIADVLLATVCYQDAETMIEMVTEMEDGHESSDGAYANQSRTYRNTYKIGMACMNYLLMNGSKPLPEYRKHSSMFEVGHNDSVWLV